MKRSFPILIMLITFLLFTTGCWNRRELNELAITLAMGLDITRDGQYLVTAQVVNPGEVAAKGGGSHSPVVIYQATGKTVFEAVRKMTKESPRKIYPSHLRILVIGESLAKKGIGKPLDVLSRDWELRSDFYVVVAKGMNAEDILRVPTALEKIPANNMFNTLEVSEKAWSGTSAISFDKLIEDMVSEGKQPVLTGIQADIKGGKKNSLSKQNVEIIDTPARVKYGNLAVFKKDKLVGWLNETESRAYNKITNNVKSSIVNVSCPNGGTAAIQVIRAKADVKGKVESGKPKVDVNIRAEGNVGEVECHLDLTKPKSIEQLEKAYEKKVIQQMGNAIQSVQEQKKVDIFGFGEAIYRAEPKAWEQLKKDWDNEFQDLSVDVKYDLQIRRVGTVGNSFLEKLK
ncbi:MULTISPECIES: Ger(x)C family spore germination protein [unclassified Bacillus (in: firmicutes)]|uniref:Ger(x)C family spore germination protein n=1 Tax=unclassified Bacillus (in: firmicutes) TaxID=185979 RepID=UPI001BEA929F|nr:MULTISPECIES: Ger(x)C family spore germination protein [unclassified Bacillus (in: firmicutes)]MBT2618876.1 Ger(x)C family spore germination protein [Bacillus sp. ISL-78]MBT2627852.1 Ger(x)C family spore germination protein [Bacillus sp. ISL-101]